jgi:hypothetical protein
MEKKLLSTKEYYTMVLFLERELDEIAAGTENLLLPAIGFPQHFTQPTSQARTLSQQSALLQEDIREAIAIFNTFAALAKVNQIFEIHPLLNKQLDAKTEPYVVHYNNNKDKFPDLAEKLKEEEEVNKRRELKMQEESKKLEKESQENKVPRKKKTG